MGSCWPHLGRDTAMLTKKQIALIHVAKKQLALDEVSYRAILKTYGGVNTSKDLDYKGFLAVMKHFERCGFRSKNWPPKKSANNRPGMATDAQLRKIKASWLTLWGSYYGKGNEWEALHGFLRKRVGVSHENFLTFNQAHQVIEAVKAIVQRRAA